MPIAQEVRKDAPDDGKSYVKVNGEWAEPVKVNHSYIAWLATGKTGTEADFIAAIDNSGQIIYGGNY